MAGDREAHWEGMSVLCTKVDSAGSAGLRWGTPDTFQEGSAKTELFP